MDRARPNGRGAKRGANNGGGGGGTKPKWNDDEVEQAAVARFDIYMVKLQNQNSLFVVGYASNPLNIDDSFE